MSSVSEEIVCHKNTEWIENHLNNDVRCKRGYSVSVRNDTIALETFHFCFIRGYQLPTKSKDTNTAVFIPEPTPKPKLGNTVSTFPQPEPLLYMVTFI